MLVLNVAFLSVVGMLARVAQVAVAAHGVGLRVQSSAFVPGFGVSNLGVPAREARRLLFTLEAAAPSVEKPGEAEKD